jgi:hypothetical protein
MVCSPTFGPEFNTCNSARRLFNLAQSLAIDHVPPAIARLAGRTLEENQLVVQDDIEQ